MTRDRAARIASLHDANSRKTHEAALRLRNAAEALVEAGERVTVHSTATRAGVARSFVYNHPELLAFVRELGTSSARLNTPRSHARASEASLRTRLADALDRNRELHADIVVIKAEREALLNEVRLLRHQLRAAERAE